MNLLFLASEVNLGKKVRNAKTRYAIEILVSIHSLPIAFRHDSHSILLNKCVKWREPHSVLVPIPTNAFLFCKVSIARNFERAESKR